ncbi:MAG: hypothetical protein ABJX32_13070 [Tateyamaria sp.]|uniref:hypothetical protein n=1 Tax=Tateyamaria sp. TaxID=1929288 RepID=UPI00329E1D29
MLHNQLGVRQVLYSLWTGSVLSEFSTGLQLLLSHQHQRTVALQAVNQVDKAIEQSLEVALRR